MNTKIIAFVVIAVTFALIISPSLGTGDVFAKKHHKKHHGHNGDGGNHINQQIHQESNIHQNSQVSGGYNSHSGNNYAVSVQSNSGSNNAGISR